jgi:hypothetical protein
MTVMRNDDSLPSGLGCAVDVLREEPEVRQEWMDGVVRAAALQRHDDATAPNARRWSFRPSIAIAAGLAFAAVGSGVTYAVMRGHSSLPNSAPIVTADTAGDKSPVRFSLVAPNAMSVTLVGDFNGWNPTTLPMRRSASGITWEVEIGLPPGRYTYAFVVDGHLARDPAAAESAHDDFGAPSSVLLVKGS